MFDYLRGTLAVLQPNHAVLDVQGAGYRLEIPLSTYERLTRGAEATILTWLRVTDDDLRLYGFATERERELFLRLVGGVSGLGPAKALAILSSAGVDGLTRAIEGGDADFLRRIKGIGDKMAKRLIVELRGKLPEETEGKGSAETSNTKDAITALQVLGYDRREAEEAVRKAARGLSGEAGVEELVRQSLDHVRR